MISNNEPGDDIPEATPVDPVSIPPLPADPLEEPVPVPKDDPAVIVTGKPDYNNSLNALLQKNRVERPDSSLPEDSDISKL
jgi:hypothetical protein